MGAEGKTDPMLMADLQGKTSCIATDDGWQGDKLVPRALCILMTFTCNLYGSACSFCDAT